MGVQLPGELAGVAEKAGVRWPEADEDAMRGSAEAWREAGRQLESVAGDADGVAKNALGTVHGANADAARERWNSFVAPDSGFLSSAVKGCHAAADRLDHAAEQVGAAKVEIVRQLVDLAKTTDAADAAALSGNPAALLSADSVAHGVSTNVAHLHDTLTTAVRQDSGASVLGTHGPASDALSAVPAQSLVDPGAGPGVGPGVGAGTGPGVGPGAGVGVGGEVSDAAQGIGGLPGVAGPGGHHGGGWLDQAHPHPAHEAQAPELPWSQDPEDTGPIPLPDPSLTESDTGPIAIPDAAAAGQQQSGAGDPVGPAAPAGQTVEQASAAVLDGPPRVLPPVDPGVAPAPPAGGGVAGGGAGGGFAGGGFGAVGGVAGGAGGGGAGGAAAGGAAAGGAAAGGLPGPRAAERALGAGPGRADRAWFGADPGRAEARPERADGGSQAGAARSARAQQENQSVIALFRVHMFPIGHLPVPANRPARQVPPPPDEFDYAAGLRFPPGDHPSSELVNDSWALAAVRAGHPPLRLPAGLAADDPQVAELTDDYDPLGGGHEREWDRRFVVRGADPEAGVTAEYSWPPSELFPEGGTDHGEALVLPPGTELDRFGPAEGRVLSEAGTAFARRSLPPNHVPAGYHRYRVVEPLPVWRAASAPWFAQQGGGERYRTTYPVADLVTLGYLSDVTHEVSGKDGAE